jgi:glycosyltransferase involved in cell wall biosynthesis
MRVLLVAEDCNPNRDSTPGVAYRACAAIADHAEVTLATPIKNQVDIDPAGGCGKAEVVYIDNSRVHKPLYALATWLRKRAGWTSYVAVAYLFEQAFEWGVWRRFKADLRAGRFDVVHRITPMSPTIPSPLAKWCPAPFVIGPINGGLPWPKGFESERRREREWMTYLRGAYRFLPYHGATFQKAAAILAGFEHTIADLPADARDKAVDFPEVGFDPALFNAPAERDTNDRLTFIFVGRLVPIKCPDILVQAFAASAILKQHRLLFVGDGPERDRLEAMVRTNNLTSCVEFAGRRSYAEVGELMRASDVFAFPSIHELGAGVVIEAMACGLPCVVAGHGAPGHLVYGVGAVVPVSTKVQMTEDFTKAMEALATDSERRREWGRLASQRARTHYSWDAKARKTVDVYEWALGQRATKPVFGDN